MNDLPFTKEGYSFSADENDIFDENLDLFDQQQFGDYEDGIGYSEVVDEDELDEELEDSEDQLYIDYEINSDQLDNGDKVENDDYDSLDD